MKNSFTDKSDDKNNTENQNSESVEDRNPLHLSEYLKLNNDSMTCLLI